MRSEDQETTLEQGHCECCKIHLYYQVHNTISWTKSVPKRTSERTENRKIYEICVTTLQHARIVHEIHSVCNS